MTEQPPVALAYDNRTGRGPGAVLRTLGRVHPGIRAVQRQVDPYADAWHAHNRRALTVPGRRWIVLGDSMSQGIGASAWDAGWVDQLAATLADRGHPLTVVNLSATGARVPDVVDQQLPALSALPAAPGTTDPDLVTVLVGSNDLFAGGALRDGLPGAFERLLEGLPHGAVVATLPQPRSAARGANVHVELARASGRVHMVDLRTDGPDSWRGRLAADWFHPNDAGYAQIATAFLPRALEALA